MMKTGGAHLPLPVLEPVGGERLMSVMCGQCAAWPTVTFPAASITANWLVLNYTAWWQSHMCVNNLPRQQGDWDSNSRPIVCKSIASPLRHRATHRNGRQTRDFSVKYVTTDRPLNTVNHLLTYSVEHPCNSWEHYKNVNRDITLRSTLKCTITSNNS